ncbi:DMT family transporter [Streptomyces lonarensis]|uniref:DMT family transporter n=1 Tax=Streptomyces lonarensis TaxID=700599 RepID=A0A7X6HY93_9ACTN|nr:DMT family transporter [Streptomyces lonarensis]NJQ05353.1 DMT family transporter [Streptomyces lonarensis]
MRDLGWAAGFVVLWSSGFVGAVLAQPADSPAGVLAWRYVATAAILATAVLITRRTAITGRELVRQSGVGLLAHVVFLGGVFGASSQGVGAGTVALVCAVQPMLVMLVGRFAWGDSLRRRQVFGAAVGLAAVALSVGGGFGSSGAGLLLPVASLLGLSGAALLERRRPPTADTLTCLCVQVVVSAAVFLAFAAATGGLALDLTPSVAGALAWLVVLSGLGGYTAFVVCLRRLGSSRTSLLLYLTPPVTTLWAWAMFSDAPGAAQWSALALAGVAVVLSWPAPARGGPAESGAADVGEVGGGRRLDGAGARR